MRAPANAQRAPRALVVLVAAVGLLATACFGDDDDAGTIAPGGFIDTTDENVDGTFDPFAMVLFWAEAEIAGLGGGARYVYIPDEAIRQEIERLDEEEILAEGEDFVVFRDREGESETTSVGDGTCLLGTPVQYRSAGGEIFDLGSVVFNASFRASQNEFFSIADNGSNAHGGLAKGGADRDDREEWDIFRDGPLDYQIRSVELSDDVLATVLTARWDGRSVENFRGAEAQGNVKVACVFVDADVLSG